jgi:hypothetical protein
METPVTPLSITYNSEQPELKLNSPQGLIFKFWSDYHSKTPGKVTSVLPSGNYGSFADSERSCPSLSTFTYEEAVQQCRDDVRAIVKDCERTNNKFSDPEFDIEKDFFNCDYNCLFGISRASDGDDDQPTKPGSVHRIPWICFESGVQDVRVGSEGPVRLYFIKGLYAGGEKSSEPSNSDDKASGLHGEVRCSGI